MKMNDTQTPHRNRAKSSTKLVVVNDKLTKPHHAYKKWIFRTFIHRSLFLPFI